MHLQQNQYILCVVMSWWCWYLVLRVCTGVSTNVNYYDVTNLYYDVTNIYYYVTNPASMTSLTLYYDVTNLYYYVTNIYYYVTNPASMTSLTPLL